VSTAEQPHVVTATEERVPVVLPEVHVVGTPVGPDALESYDADRLWKRGLDLLDGDSWAEAASYFERLLREFPDDGHVLLAHYNLGVAYIHLEKGNEAVTEFDTYLKLIPPDASPKDLLDGRFKRGQALAVAKRYEEVAAFFDDMLGEELSKEDRIEALVDAGIGHFMRGDRFTAEYRFLEARRHYKEASETARLDIGYYVAQASFYLAEIARIDFSEFKLQFPTAAELQAGHKTLEAILGDQLEQKCQLLLRAQYAYLRAIREGHAGWASASGFKVGEMYEELHDDLVKLPAPPDLGDSARDLYQSMVRKKVLVLLEKAVKTWEANADMVTRTGAESEWSTRTRASLLRVKQAIQDEQALTEHLDDDGHDKRAHDTASLEHDAGNNSADVTGAPTTPKG
jgi:tetratricopeptide (TPR) repeat protein